MRQPGQPTRIPPQVSVALRFLPPLLRVQLARGKAERRTFRTLLIKLTQGQPVEKSRFGQLARLAADRALDLDIRAKTRKRNPPKNTRNFNFANSFLARIPKKPKVLIFKSGAIMEVHWQIGEFIHDGPRPFAGSPRTSQGIRIIVKPNANEQQLKGFSRVSRAIRLPLPQDSVEELINAIGYFGMSVHITADKNGQKRPTAVVWTRQARGIPTFLTAAQKRYENWDLELLRYLAPVLKSMGVTRIAFHVEKAQQYPKSVVIQYEQLKTHLLRQGYQNEPLFSSDFLSQVLLKPGQSELTHTKFLVHDF
jgi:hypothetical protein